ncbi:hypothetical protein DV737_g2879, partial [Chaetothyriales sp. CBS 132003]
MDSSELPATFSVDPSQFLAVIAGGQEAIIRAVEEAEDSEADGFEKLRALRLTGQDTVVGISASGRTPFILGGLKNALVSGALTAAITNVHPSDVGRLGLKHCISTVVGPEFVAGSTRLKAGSSAKQIINMISTCAMIKMGKTWRGLMIDVRVKNKKLQARGRKIVRQPVVIPDTPEGDAILDSLIAVCGNSVKLAVAVVLSGLDPDAAQKQLKLANDDLGIFVQALSARTFKPRPVLADEQEYFVAIDGGGTNCTVCIATRSGIVARGTSGACNYNCVSLEQLLDQITSARANALAQAADGNFWVYGAGMPRFRKVWAGIAGLHHAYHLEPLTDRLEELFGVSSSDGNLYLSSDSMLPKACIGDDPTVEGGLEYWTEFVVKTESHFQASFIRAEKRREKSPDGQSLAILKAAAASLAEIVAPLTKKRVCDPSTSLLVLSGALMDLPAYRRLLLDSLASLQPVPFKKTVSLHDTAGCAAQFLARRA